jgi:hypothetical protein
LGKVDEAPNERTHPSEQLLLDLPPITPVCLNYVTSASLFAAKVVPTRWICFARRQAKARQ